MNRLAAIGVLLLATMAPPIGDHGDHEAVVKNLHDGENYLCITVNADGSVVSRPLPVANVAPGPTPVPPPQPPSELTARAKEIKALAQVVTGDPNRSDTAKGLAMLYRKLGEAANTGKVVSTPALFDMVKMGTDLVLAKNPGKWQSVRDLLSLQWSRIPAGSSVGEYGKLLVEVADGLDASAPERQISPELWDLILKIIELILSLFNK